MKRLLLLLPIIVLLTACGEPEVKATPVAHDLIENPGAFKTK